MAEDLHQIIDGELPDDATAEYLHLLSVDPEKRALFRQQLRLQKELYRNECHGRLSAAEEAEMLQRLTGAIGTTTTETLNRWFNRAALTALGIGLLVGTGSGYAMRGALRNDEPNPVVKTAEPSVRPAPVIIQPFDRDSLATAVRDSVLDAMDSVITAMKASATVTKRRPTVRKPSAPRYGGSDLTGRTEVLKNRNKSRKK
jgi:hypothetical protein